MVDMKHFVCDNCGEFYELDADDDVVVSLSNDTGIFSAQCEKSYCSGTCYEYEIYHYRCSSLLKHLSSVMVYNTEGNMPPPAGSITCHCSKKANYLDSPASIYYCSSETCNNYLCETVSEEYCNGEDKAVTVESRRWQCDTEPTSLVEYPIFAEEEETGGGNEGAERRFISRLRHYNTNDSSGHGKGKRISSGNSRDRHQHGQKRKSDRVKTLANRVIVAFDELDKNSSYRTKYKGTVDKLKERYG